MNFNVQSITRRKFITDTAKVTTGLAVFSTLSSCSSTTKSSILPVGRVLGANDTINIAVIGTKGRGGGLIYDFGKQKNVRIAALCDIDENVLDSRGAEFKNKMGYDPKKFKDMRKLFDDKDIDAVVVATPNHWHALATIWACQAGKHVYVEKPCSHNVFEAAKMVEAARKYNRIVQVGFQNRSIQNVRQAMAFLKSGGIGEVYKARGLCFKPRGPIGLVPDGILPGQGLSSEYLAKVDYDLWLGPAPLRPFNNNRFHYNWHWHWDYGNGDIGNQGPHQFDVARWGLGKDEHPVMITAAGGYYGKKSTQETPNTETCELVYADGKILSFEVRGLPTNSEGEITVGDMKLNGIKIGNFFYGTEGWMYLDGGRWQSFKGQNNEPGPGSGNTETEYADPTNLAGAGGGGHAENFVYAMRQNDHKALTCDIQEGYMSSVLPHFANISYRLGRSLNFDPAAMKFKGDSEANNMLTRDYRKPFVVPEKV